MWNPFKPKSTPLSPDDFAASVTAEIRKLNPNLSVQYHKDQFRLEIDGGKSNIFLHNIYDTYIRGGQAQLANAIRVAAGLSSNKSAADEPFSQIRPKLLPKLRERFYHESLSLAQRLESSANPCECPPVRLPQICFWKSLSTSPTPSRSSPTTC